MSHQHVFEEHRYLTRDSSFCKGALQNQGTGGVCGGGSNETMKLRAECYLNT